MDSGTVTISSITSTHLSGTADLVMYSLVDYAINGNDNPPTKPLSINFANVPLEAASRSATVREALEHPDRSFSFRRERKAIPGGSFGIR